MKMWRLNPGVEQSMKGSDLWQDAQNYKRKKGDNGGAEAFSFGKKDGEEDEDYGALLDALESYINDDEVDEEEEDDDNVDPDYKIFFDNLREDGNSYVFEMDKDDGTRISVKFEEENGGEGGGVDDVRKRGVDHERCRGVKRNGNGTEFRSLLMDVDAQMLAQADENYLMFLSRAWVVGDRLVYEDQDGVIRYEVDDGMPGAAEDPGPVEETSAEEEDDYDEEDSDDDDDDEEDGDEEEDEEYEIDFPSYTEKEFTPVTTLKTDNNVIVDIADDDDDDDTVPLGGFDLNSEFLEKLRKELQKPFKLKEYKRKMKEASVHRPLDRAREFRGGLRKSYRTLLTSLSYFYRYPDLAHKVEVAVQNKEKNRALALLRCLFLYLKNLPHGVSKPWEHPSVLEWVQCPSIMDSARMKHEASPKVLLPC